MHRLVFGLEEEVFITEPERPTLQSLYYLGRLVWMAPCKFYAHTHCNFPRGKDLRYGLMSGVEISTAAHADKSLLIEDLLERRRALAGVCSGLIVPLGHLLDRPQPTNICGMHIHISGFSDFERAYRNLIYFLPLLLLLVANSPGFGDTFFGPSFRLAQAFAIGPLREDKIYRFQDVILSKRLGTLEIRAFDPVWDVGRIRLLLDCLEAVLLAERDYPGAVEEYNRLRMIVAREGYCEELVGIYRDLAELLPVPEEIFLRPPAYEVWDLYKEAGILGTYSALDSAYRGGPFRPREIPHMKFSWAKVLAGVCGYALPRLPYNIRKVWLEW
ncbi:MAG: hypothetical protein ACPLTR_00870 [Thermacetogeniaceae bacterium]